MKLWSDPFKHIEIPNTAHIRSIEYSFLNKLIPINNDGLENQKSEEDLPVDTIVARLKSDVLHSKRPRNNTQQQLDNMSEAPPISTTYFLDWSISEAKNADSMHLLNKRDVIEQLRMTMAAILLPSDNHSQYTGIQQIPILADYLIELIEKSRKKINSLDATLRSLVSEQTFLDSSNSGGTNIQANNENEEKTSVILAYQLVSLIDREEKLVEKYILLRSRLVDVDKLNEQLLRILWKYRPKKI